MPPVLSRIDSNDCTNQPVQNGLLSSLKTIYEWFPCTAQIKFEIMSYGINTFPPFLLPNWVFVWLFFANPFPVDEVPSGYYLWVHLKEKLRKLRLKGSPPQPLFLSPLVPNWPEEINKIPDSKNWPLSHRRRECGGEFLFFNFSFKCTQR